MSLPVVAETAPIDTDSMILSAAQQNLSDTVMAACAAGGCPLDSVAVQLHANDGIVTLDRVILTPAQGTEAEKAIQLTRSALGGEISVTIQKEA